EQKYPFFGSIAGKVLGSRQPGMPANVGIPYSMSIGLRPGYFGGNYLGVQDNPFETEGDPNADNFTINNMQLASDITVARLEDRRSLNGQLDQLRRTANASRGFSALDRFDQQA